VLARRLGCATKECVETKKLMESDAGRTRRTTVSKWRDWACSHAKTPLNIACGLLGGFDGPIYRLSGKMRIRPSNLRTSTSEDL
jgi:hypothetical protein